MPGATLRGRDTGRPGVSPGEPMVIGARDVLRRVRSCGDGWCPVAQLRCGAYVVARTICGVGRVLERGVVVDRVSWWCRGCVLVVLVLAGQLVGASWRSGFRRRRDRVVGRVASSVAFVFVLVGGWAVLGPAAASATVRVAESAAAGPVVVVNRPVMRLGTVRRGCVRRPPGTVFARCELRSG